jgi:NDP-sugar pyrophosphorylase family protein
VIHRAVVMAAGEGRRLRPVTERWAKPVLPLDGRPVIATLLHELVAAGVGEITVVVGHLAGQIERLLAGFPAELRFVLQPERLGSGDAVALAAAEPPYLVTAADTAFRPGDLAAFAAAAEGAAGAIAVRRDPRPDPLHRHGIRVEDGRVTRVLDDDPQNPLAGAPLWMVGAELHGRILARPGSPPYELATAFQLAVDAGDEVRGVEIGRTRDLTDPLDLMEENFPYLGGIE